MQKLKKAGAPSSLVALLLCACGPWPPVVDSRRDVERLEVDTRSVRARDLPVADLGALERLRGLKDLDFASGWGVTDGRLTDDGVARIAALDLPSLELLDLGFCGISDVALGHVARMRTVRMLMLFGCQRITDDGLAHLLAMKRLDYLDLRGCPGITDRGLEILSTKTDWTVILFDGCPRVTPAAVTRLQAAVPDARISKHDEQWTWTPRK